MYSRENITFRITGGNTGSVFRIDTISGDLFNTGSLDYELSYMYDLTVEALYEDSAKTIRDTTHLTIYVNNLNDNPPEAENMVINIDENINENNPLWTNIDTLNATDADGDINPLSYAIISGNENGIFQMNPTVGALNVRYDSIDYEKQASYVLVVEVSDGTYTEQATITIQINDLVETSVISITEPGLISLYPNPTNGILYINLQNTHRGGLEVNLMDIRGKVIFRNTGNINQLDLTSFQKGVYFITIRSKDYATTRKIIKL